ncbi:5440_t:CDS:2 [Paraglomus brasilianum]|uniref:5440_t:CDS:1 n=1 Tax=Paraglomus brasilianum TaxID=144538 RepID=A0A9N9A6L4_9GLOM|nr:5440_t:CDS:2 [Paraglomus brasilianum]
MAQPNLTNIANAFQNLPVVATATQFQNLTTQIQSLTRQQQNFTTQLIKQQQDFTTQLQALTTQTQALTTQIQALTTQIQNLTRQQQDFTRQQQALTQSIDQLEQRTQARIVNFTILDDRTAIEPLNTNAGVIPPNFLQDFNAIKNAQSTEITLLLAAYGQPTNGNLTTRKRRLAKYLGIRSLF